MKRLAIVACMVLLAVFGVGVAASQSAQNQTSEVPTVDEEAYTQSIGAGVNVVDSEVIQQLDGGAQLQLTIDSESSQSVRIPQVYQAMQNSGRVRYRTVSLAEGRTEVKIRSFKYSTETAKGKVYVSQIVNGGHTYFILTNTESGDLSYPPVGEEAAYLFGALGIVSTFSAWVWYKRRSASSEPQEVKP